MKRIVRFVVLSVLITFLWTYWAAAHGTMEDPISRAYNCFQENPENPTSDACQAAKAVGGTQAFYDWYETNQNPAGDHYRAGRLIVLHPQVTLTSRDGDRQMLPLFILIAFCTLGIPLFYIKHANKESL